MASSWCNRWLVVSMMGAVWACSTGVVTPSEEEAERPTVVSSSVTDGQKDVPRDVAITVQFSEAMDAGSFAGAVTLVDLAADAPVDLTVSYDSEDRTLSITANALLAAAAEHRLQLSDAIKSEAGEALVPWSIVFETVDLPALSIVSITPSNGAVDVALSAPIVIDADEALDSSSVTDATVLLYETASETPVAHTRQHDGASITLTATLENYRDYTVELTSELTGASGAQLIGGYSASFRTADVLPPEVVHAPAPVLVNNRAGPQVTFTWDPASDADTGIGGYHIQYRVNEETPEVAVILGDVLTHTREAMASTGQVIYARLAAVDGAGNVSDWSDWSEGAVVDATAPSVPSLSSPGSFSGADVTYTWTTSVDVGGAELAAYVLQVWSTPNTSGDLLDETTVAETPREWTFDASALDGQTLYARIAARDAVGNQSAWSSFTSGTTIDLLPPTTPGKPDAGMAIWNVDAQGPVVFHWEESFDANGILRYDVQIEINGTPTSATAVTNSYTRAGLTDGQSIIIRVRAVDNAGTPSGYSDWSEPVVVDNGLPSAPTNFAVSPARQYANVDQVTYTFGAPEDGSAGSYRLRVGSSPEGSQYFQTENADEFSHTVVFADPEVVPPGDGDTLYAQVAAVSPAGNPGPWSEVVAITLDLEPPDPPGTPTHSHGSESGYLLSFSWTPSTDDVSYVEFYQVEVLVNGAPQAPTYQVVEPSFPFDASDFHGDSVAIRVQAVDAADNESDWSDPSAPVTVDAVQPQVSGASPDPEQWVSIATEIHVWFDKAMDDASLRRPGAFTLVDENSGTPVRTLLYYLTEEGRKLVAVPDPTEPQATVDGSNVASGLTNGDVLQGGRTYTVQIRGMDDGELLATDQVGNPLVDFTRQFHTAPIESPALLSVHAGEHDLLMGPAPASALQDGQSLELEFDQPMDPTRARIRLTSASGGEWQASLASVRIDAISAESDGESDFVRYTYHRGGYDPIEDGQDVVVSGTTEHCAEETCEPSCFDGAGQATVLSDHEFTLPINCAGKTGGGGHVAYASPAGSLEWTAPTTLTLHLHGFEVGEAAELELRINEVSGVHRNWTETRHILQTQGPADDDTPPTLRYARLVGQPRFPEIFLAFSEPVDVTTLDFVTLTGSGVDTSDFRRRYSLDGLAHTVTYSAIRAMPQTPTQITISVPAGVKDLAGNAFSPTTEVVTAPGGSTPEARQVIATTPPHNHKVRTPWSIEAEVGGYVAVGGQAYPLAEGVDPASLDLEDVRVVRHSDGWVSRGWQIAAMEGVVQLQPAPHHLGTPLDRVQHAIVSAEELEGRIRFETAGPHGLLGGEIVDATAMGGGGEIYDARYAVVLDATIDSFDVESPGTIAGGGKILVTGQLEYDVPTRYNVFLGDNEGILDLYGRAVASEEWSFTVQPEWDAVQPYIDSLAWLELQVNTAASADRSESARGLRVGFSVVYPEFDDSLAYELSDGLSSTSLLAGALEDSWVDYYADADSGENRPEAMTATLYPTSGYYPFQLRITEGATTHIEYTRLAWVWSADDTPKTANINDDGLVLAVSAADPVLVTQTSTPTFTWTGSSGAADVQAFWLVEIATMFGGGGHGFGVVEPLSSGTTNFAVPAAQALEAGIYLWTVNAHRDDRMYNRAAEAVSLWFPEVMRNVMIYGPNNPDLATVAGTEYGLAQAFVGGSTSDDAWNAVGLANFDSSSDTTFAFAVDMDNGDPFSGSAYYAYDAQSGRFKTLTLAGGDEPAVTTGWLGRGGDLLMQTDPVRPAHLLLGTRRYDDTLSSLPHDTWSIAMFHIDPSTEEAWGMHGTLSKGTEGFLDINIIENDATSDSKPDFFQYTVSDGRLTIMDPDAEGTPEPMLSGYIGGGAGSEIAALASVVPGEGAMLAFIARSHDLSGVESCADLAGAYGLSVMRAEHSESSMWVDTLEGVLAIDESGSAFVDIAMGNHRMRAAQNCTVETQLERKIVVLEDPEGGMSRVELQVGPDASTLFGIRVGVSSSREFVLITKL